MQSCGLSSISEALKKYLGVKIKLKITWERIKLILARVRTQAGMSVIDAKEENHGRLGEWR